MTSMMKVFSFAVILMIGVGIPAEHAEAKRFGGGMSFGKMFSTPKKAPVAPAKKTPATNPAAPNKTTTPAAKPGMGGLMGGLLAGGLLGALFFGGAFDGIQMMDIVLIALIGFILYSLFARKPRTQQPNYSPAGSAERYQEEPQQPEYQPQAFEQQGSILGGGLSEAEVELPDWFNKDAFLKGATQHFETLQHAWGENNLALIEEYCHPEFYLVLVAERAKIAEEHIQLDVVSVMAEILGFQEMDSEAQLSIHFYGWMKEGAGEETSEFSEIWHLTRDTLEPNADWYLVGIEQPQ